MFGVDYSEMLVIGLVALVVIGPKDLPRVLRQVGQWVGKGRAMARHFRSGIDTMIREAELDEMNKQWAAQNAAIMQARPPLPDPEALADHAGIAAGLAATPEQRADLFATHGEAPLSAGGAGDAPAADLPPIPAPHIAPDPNKPPA